MPVFDLLLQLFHQIIHWQNAEGETLLHVVNRTVRLRRAATVCLGKLTGTKMATTLGH